MRSALGRGANALFSDETVASVSADVPPSSSPASGPTLIPLEKIRANPKQPRRHFDETSLAELTASIKDRGVLQPILVSPVEDHYEIIAGERRWRAAQRAGLTEIPAVVRGGSESERFEIALIENIQRQDLNPIEQAEGYHRLQNDFGMTQEKIAAVIGKDRAVIANTLRLLNLPDEIRQSLREGKITMGHARALVSIDDSAAQMALFVRILTEQLPVRLIEQAVREHKKGPKKVAATAVPSKPAEVKQLETELQQALGRKVDVLSQGSSSHQGWIKLEFYSLDDLDVLIMQLKKASA